MTIASLDTYEVSTFGRVRNKSSKHILKGKIDKDGYHRVTFHVRANNYKKDFLVHRLVAYTFIENPKGYEQIDHIDHNRMNNTISNLRWCDSQMNNCNRINQSQFGAHISEMSLKNCHYWRLNFHGRGVKILKNFNKNSISLTHIQIIRDIIEEDLGYTAQNK